MSVTRASGPIAPVHVPKPWGHETVWAQTERYVGKILHVRAGESLSLQYHRRKEETMRVLSGILALEVGSEGEELSMRIIYILFLAGTAAGLAYRASFADWRARFRTGN